MYDSKNCIIHATETKKVVVQGLDGYIIAEEDGMLLICKLSEEQRIKQFSEDKWCGVKFFKYLFITLEENNKWIRK